jgi:glycosyltransferase involved in cell wall biosynthesis
MRILIVVPRQDHNSGNWVSARRFQGSLKDRGHLVQLLDTPLQAEASLGEQLSSFTPDVAILLHAYRSGKPWLEATTGMNVPSVVVLTGTDVNHGLEDPGQSEIIRDCLDQAAFVLLQNSLIAAEFSATHPQFSGHLRVFSPGVSLGESHYDLRGSHALAKDKTLFLCPAGVRPVKGVLELLELFDRVRARSTTFQLVFCGPILDESYGERFRAAVSQRSWASYLGIIPAEAITTAMRAADVILNNSRSEGLANALLEAATIGVPILAHNIPGNAAVVSHNDNGLLYNDQADFDSYALQLLSRDRRQQLCRPAPQRYSAEKEAAELEAILQEAAKN